MRQLKITKSINNKDSISVERRTPIETLSPKYEEYEESEESEESEIIKLVKEGNKKAIHFLPNFRELMFSLYKSYQKGDKFEKDIFLQIYEGIIEAAKQFDGIGDFKSFAETFIRKSIEKGIEEHKDNF